MITVYYGCHNVKKKSHDFCYEPEPVASTIVDDLGVGADHPHSVHRCPSFNLSIKNLYKVKATIDYELTWDGQELNSSMYDQAFYDANIVIRNKNLGFFGYCDPSMYLFTDADDLEMESLPTMFEKQNLIQGNTIVGRYNIAKHFRKLEWAFLLREPQTIAIKAGTPLYYLKFHTKEKINFKRFFITPELFELHGALLNYRSHTTKMIPLEWYYGIVCKYYKKKYLQLIKANILD
jgi:hypothetical protein